MWPCFRKLLTGAALAAAVACGHGFRLGQENKDDEPLLLLNGSSAIAAGRPVADNSRCHVCHLNYASEQLAVEHAAANIGCERCHGKSDAHCGDEDNVTAPEILYAKAAINLSCFECHPRDDLSAVHEPFLAGGTKEKYCTDCHGKHRLAVRTRRWDPETGKLIYDDKVRMLER